MGLNKHEKKMINLVKHNSTKHIKVSKLKSRLYQKVWGGKIVPHKVWKHPSKNKQHRSNYQRIKEAELKYPIIVTKKGNGKYHIHDGAHRLAKAHFIKKQSQIKVKILNNSQNKKYKRWKRNHYR